jgi:multidrug efflux system outer membrane protein
MMFQKYRKLAPVVAPLVAALVLAGCAAPEFHQPQVATPMAFKEDAAAGKWKPAQPAEAQARGEWWKAFHDARLDLLVAEATAANQNLAAAAARVKQARALAGVARADRIPQVGLQAGVQRGRDSAVAQGLAPGSPVTPGNVFQAGLGIGYELDLFGRVASNVSAAQADAAGSEATFRSVLLALQADVAQTWLRLRGTDAELDLLGQTVGLREESVRITQRRFELGQIGELDLARAKSELALTRADAVALTRQRSQLEHALAVLLGRPAAAFGALHDPLPEGGLPAIPAGLPSALLERRPDIAAAQRAMIAANARIGVARAARFPLLQLTGAGGGESADLSDLFKWSSRSWLLGAALSLPLVDGGRGRANVERSEAVLEEAVAIYRQDVLTAFAEVEDNLSGLRTLAEQAEEIDAAQAAAQRSSELADKLYRGGRSSYLDLLDAQRNLASAQRTAVQLRSERALATVALIRALGGGWETQSTAINKSGA